MQLEDFVREWTVKGDNDLASATFLMNMRPVPLEIVGFHCQQAVEKYLKGYLVLKGVEPEKTHDLGLLLNRCIIFNSTFSELAETCALLSDYAVKARYPSSMSLDNDHISRTLTLAQSAVQSIAARIAEDL